jgi:two-component system, cell cycle sensor histidine kinase and response regulator CckA
MPEPLKVLIVEDNPDDLQLICRELTQGGFVIDYRQVETPEAFLAALAEPGWQIILCDYCMPRFSGLAALQLLQASQRDLPFILISGTVGEEIAVQSMLAGANDYVLKDKLTRLTPAIRRELRSAEIRQQRRTAEAELLNNQQLLELIYHHSSDLMGLFQIDSEGDFKLLSINHVALQAAQQIGIKVQLQELIGVSLCDILINFLQQTPEQIASKYAEYRQAIQDGQVINAELALRFTPEPRYYEEHLIPLINQQSQPPTKYVLWSARDITQRRNDLERQRKLEQQLQESQKLESLGLLAGGIAHDFNNLLSAILNYASVGLEALPDAQTARTNLELIQATGQMAAGLTRELLAYSGKGTVLTQTVQINQIIREMLPLFRTSLSINTDLQTDLAEPLPELHADVNQLRQVLLNLVLNANDSLHNKSGVVKVTTIGNPRLQTGLEWLLPDQPQHPSILIKVSDTGCGLDPATKRRIFDPFFTTKATGRGLGLSAVLGIIRAHLGNLAVTSSVGRGTTFWIHLPVADLPAHPRTQLAHPEIATTANMPPMLVIDDNELVRNSVAAVLKSKGYQVLLAACGQSGLEQYKQHQGQVSIVILDMTMPGISGEEVFTSLRQTNPEQRIIITTGHSVEDISRKFLTQQGVGFVQKASGPAVLLQEIQRLLVSE